MIAWVLAFGMGLAVVYGLNVKVGMEPPSHAVSVIYGGFHRLAWSLALGWVIFACARGYGGKNINQGKPFTDIANKTFLGWINEFLSWGGFIPLSRMSYVIYLIHVTILDIVRSVYHYNIDGSVTVIVSQKVSAPKK